MWPLPVHVFLLILTSTSVCHTTFHVGRYQETRVDEPDPEVPWQGWASPQGTETVSSISGVDDGPFDLVRFQFPFFSFDSQSVSISPNGFLSLKQSPLCRRPSTTVGLPLDIFCHTNQTGFYKVVQGTDGRYYGGNHPLIGPMVEDLNPGADGDAAVYYWIDSKYSPSQQVLVVEWDNVPIFGSKLNRFTMQVEIMANGTIIFRYKKLKLPGFMSDTKTPPFVGLVWTKLQRRILSYPISDKTVIRLEYSEDRCPMYNNCEACLQQTSTGWDETTSSPYVVECHWCSNLNLCVPGDLVADFCSNADHYYRTCNRSDVHAFYYTQSIEYLPADQFPTGGHSVVNPGIQLPFFSNPPDYDTPKPEDRISISSMGYVSFGKNVGDQIMSCSSMFPQCLSSISSFEYTASVFRTLLTSSTVNDTWMLNEEVPSRIIHWPSSSLVIAPIAKFAFQLQLFADGRIKFRYGTPANCDPPCLDAAIWSSFPEPFIGLTRSANSMGSASIVPWQLLRAGAVISFIPIPGCIASCLYDACNHSSRTCLCFCQHGSCAEGSKSNGLCETCNAGWAGPLCNKSCTCHPAHGVCDDGPDGDGHCKVPCVDGFGGVDCDTCLPHHFGPECKRCPCHDRMFCFDGMEGNGTCSGCKNGWIGPNCSVCSPRHAGPDCLPCSCAHGDCDDGIQGTGTCRSCDLGWAGPSCNISCSCSGAHMNCFEGIQGNGLCYCDPGWSMTEDCEDCDAEHYGPACELCLCRKGRCDSGVNGSGWCMTCDLGYYGRYCERLSQTSSGMMGAIIIIIIFSLMLLCGCIIVIVFILFRRKRGPVGALLVERRPGGEREIIPIPHVPIQSNPVQGIPLHQIPLLEMQCTQMSWGHDGYPMSTDHAANGPSPAPDSSSPTASGRGWVTDASTTDLMPILPAAQTNGHH